MVSLSLGHSFRFSRRETVQNVLQINSLYSQSATCQSARQLFEYLKAQENFQNEANKKFVLKQFRKTSIRKVYDSLHGISDEAIPLSNAVEIMAYCLVDGKVEQESPFEMNLYNELVEQLKSMKAGLNK